MKPTLNQIATYYPPYVTAAMEAYRHVFGEGTPGVHSTWDWNRMGFVAGLVSGPSVLDVGVGHGAMLHILLGAGRFERVCGADIRRNQKLRLPSEAEFHLMDVADLAFSDREFDTVLCMEVIEHLPPDRVEPALAQLRRVARRRLIMSVPYHEPYPLYRQDAPTGHKQSFDDDKLARLFPRALATLVPRSQVDWILLAECADLPVARLTILPAAQFASALGGAPPLPVPARRPSGLVRRMAGRMKREWRRMLGWQA